MITRKINISFKWEWDLLRQTPRGLGVWGDSIFTVNSTLPNTDYWVVYDDIETTETKLLSPQNTLLFTTEPTQVKSYPQEFVDQFSLVVTPRKDIIHDNIVQTATGLPWFTGRQRTRDGTYIFNSNIDSLNKQKLPLKTKCASLICSDKIFTIGHQNRFDFANRIKDAFGDSIDLFGRGIKEFNDKAKVLEPYDYHIVLENCQEEDYWTEKLSDSYLNNCYPIYAGCPNIGRYFSNDMVSKIDVDNLDLSINIIKSVLLSNVATTNRQSIQRAKQLCLYKYNLFPIIHNIVSTNSSFVDSNGGSLDQITLRPQNAFY